MKVLLTNDDGIYAAGIEFLHYSLEKNHEVTVIAPDRERSSCGHGITLDGPLRLKEHKENWYSCSGLPADCTLIALGHQLTDSRPDLVISGINHGANLGQDCFYSGTVAGAREACFRDVKSIAVSLVDYNAKNLKHFETAGTLIALLVQDGIAELIPPKAYLNINVPNLPAEKLAGISKTVLGFRYYSEEVIARRDRTGKDYYWVGGSYNGFDQSQETDCSAIAQHKVSVSLVSNLPLFPVSTQQHEALEAFLRKYENETDFITRLNSFNQ